jgi:hypothetical protein
MVYFVDIDDTICTYEGERDYRKAKPIIERIKKINDLFESGHTVVYWTARGSTTGIDWTEITRSQLIEWGAKHSNLILGKPHYDIYIDDKSINSEVYFKSES